MSTYKERSDYIKNIAMQNKLVAHGLPIAGNPDQRRNSFFRLNDLEELNAAITDFGHFPCVIHAGFDLRYKAPVGAALPRKVLNTTIWFLSKLDLQAYSNKADAIEAAYQEADQVLTQFLSYMLSDQDNCPCCMFDFETAQIEMLGPEFNDLYGWQLKVNDSKSGDDLQYNAAHWLGNPDAAPAEADQEPLPQYAYTDNDTEFITLQSWDSEKTIEWNNTRKARFGDNPTFQLWYYEGEGLRNNPNIIIEPDQVPPMATAYTIYINTPAPAVLTIKR